MDRGSKDEHIISVTDEEEKRQLSGMLDISTAALNLAPAACGRIYSSIFYLHSTVCIVIHCKIKLYTLDFDFALIFIPQYQDKNQTILLLSLVRFNGTIVWYLILYMNTVPYR